MIETISIQMDNGEIFDGKRIGELIKYIINKFSDEGLNYDKAIIVLEKTKDALGECSFVLKSGSKEILETSSKNL